LQSRGKGCTFTPKGNIQISLDELELCGIKYNGVQCPDELWGSCLESIFGVGNDIQNITATAEGQAVLDAVMKVVYRELGNSFYMLAWFGQHKLIEDADENETYGEPDERKWKDFVDQQAACGGLMTAIDYAKEVELLANFNHVIPTEDVDGAEFVGDATALINRVYNSIDGTFTQILEEQSFEGYRPIALVSKGIFDKLRDELEVKCGGSTDGCYLMMTGRQGINGKIQPATAASNILMHKGVLVAKCNEWSIFDKIVGVHTHRVLLVAPMVLGIAYDVPSINQFGGIGLRVEQDLSIKEGGKIYMDTNFKVGTMLIDKDLMANASLILQA
jgi:hypothetical protein